jgi:hypothetical protein
VQHPASGSAVAGSQPPQQGFSVVQVAEQVVDGLEPPLLLVLKVRPSHAGRGSLGTVAGGSRESPIPSGDVHSPHVGSRSLGTVKIRPSIRSSKLDRHRHLTSIFSRCSTSVYYTIVTAQILIFLGTQKQCH